MKIFSRKRRLFCKHAPNRMGIKLVIMPAEKFAVHCDNAFGAIIGYPGDDGGICDWSATTAALKEEGVDSVCCCDLLALTLIKPPAEAGFVIAVGSAQRFGVPMGFGGPHAAFFALVKNLVVIFLVAWWGIQRHRRANRLPLVFASA